ncbi:phosphoserine phosphatase RsbU/P [Azospirillaceae bacterium]
MISALSALKNVETLPNVESASVMIVDDNRANRHLLAALLERGGITKIELAVDGADALNRVASFRPDLMLLDLMMPNVDGFEVCRRLRADAQWGDLPILVQSSLNRAEDRAKAFSAGATDYVSKPINASELLARVKIHLQHRILINDLQKFRQRTEAELALARKMQEHLMPAEAQINQLPEVVGVRLSAHFAPSSELGGDFWDMRRDAKGRLIIWLVDFSGHGVGAAFNTFRLHAILKKVTFVDFDPAAFLEDVNRRLCGLLPSGQFATMLAGVIDAAQDKFFYASAGATKPMAWALGAVQPELGENSGLPLGLTRLATYENRSMSLTPGGRLFLYSDAAIELPLNEAEVLDEAGLVEVVSNCLNERSDSVFLSRLLALLQKKGRFDDDLTALSLTRLV